MECLWSQSPSPAGGDETVLDKITPNFCSSPQVRAKMFRRRRERFRVRRLLQRITYRVRTRLTTASQRKRTTNVAMPKIFLPLDFAATITTPERVSGSNDLILPVNSISQPSLADTIAGADSRTA